MLFLVVFAYNGVTKNTHNDIENVFLQIMLIFMQGIFYKLKSGEDKLTTY